MEPESISSAEFETLSDEEAEKLLCWRLRRLLAAGYSSGQALLLAAGVHIPLTQPICPASNSSRKTVLQLLA